MKQFSLILVLATALMISSCNKQEVDVEKPVIALGIDGFPDNCDTVYFGETFRLRMIFSDNQELGSYSLDIHNNFDHHSHSTDVAACDFWPVKTPVNPFLLIQDFGIDAGTKEVNLDLNIEIPAADAEGNLDEGDYHLLIRLTDKEGWSSQKGISIKMLHR